MKYLSVVQKFDCQDHLKQDFDEFELFSFLFILSSKVR